MSRETRGLADNTFQNHKALEALSCLESPGQSLAVSGSATLMMSCNGDDVVLLSSYFYVGVNLLFK